MKNIATANKPKKIIDYYTQLDMFMRLKYLMK